MKQNLLLLLIMFFFYRIPVSGCEEGHTICHHCYTYWLRTKSSCTVCRHHVKSLQRNRFMEGMANKLVVRCQILPPGASDEDVVGKKRSRDASSSSNSNLPEYIDYRKKRSRDASSSSNNNDNNGASSSSTNDNNGASSSSTTNNNGASSSSTTTNNGASSSSTNNNNGASSFASGSIHPFSTTMSVQDLRLELQLPPFGCDGRPALQKSVSAWRKGDPTWRSHLLGTDSVDDTNLFGGDVGGDNDLRAVDGKCNWIGSFEDLKNHINNDCPSTRGECPYEDCAGAPLRKDARAHEETCGNRRLRCNACKGSFMSRRMVSHRDACPFMVVLCDNDGCFKSIARGVMAQHRTTCKYEILECPCGCDTVCPRYEMSDHVIRRHPDQHFDARLRLQEMEVEMETMRSELLLPRGVFNAGPTQILSVFNLHVPTGFATQATSTTTRDLGRGFEVAFGLAASDDTSRPGYLYIGIDVKFVSPVVAVEDSDEEDNSAHRHRYFLSLSLVARDDLSVEVIHTRGTTTEPVPMVFGSPGTAIGHVFSPSETQKRFSVRGDGSIRIRAELLIHT
jgi:hypothetical protein